jgi:hypothetical protein
VDRDVLKYWKRKWQTYDDFWGFTMFRGTDDVTAGHHRLPTRDIIEDPAISKDAMDF